LMAGKKPTNDRCQDQNHPHHDFIGVHGREAGHIGFMRSGTMVSPRADSATLGHWQTLRKQVSMETHGGR